MKFHFDNVKRYNIFIKDKTIKDTKDAFCFISYAVDESLGFPQIDQSLFQSFVIAF